MPNYNKSKHSNEYHKQFAGDHGTKVNYVGRNNHRADQLEIQAPLNFGYFHDWISIEPETTPTRIQNTTDFYFDIAEGPVKEAILKITLQENAGINSNFFPYDILREVELRQMNRVIKEAQYPQEYINQRLFLDEDEIKKRVALEGIELDGVTPDGTPFIGANNSRLFHLYMPHFEDHPDLRMGEKVNLRLHWNEDFQRTGGISTDITIANIELLVNTARGVLPPPKYIEHTFLDQEIFQQTYNFQSGVEERIRLDNFEHLSGYMFFYITPDDTVDNRFNFQPIEKFDLLDKNKREVLPFPIDNAFGRFHINHKFGGEFLNISNNEVFTIPFSHDPQATHYRQMNLGNYELDDNYLYITPLFTATAQLTVVSYSYRKYCIDTQPNGHRKLQLK